MNRGFNPAYADERVPVRKPIPLMFKLIALAVVFVLLLLGGCVSRTLVTIEAGQEGVVTEKPWFFGQGGVRQETLKPGSHWEWRTNSVNPVDVTPQTLKVGFNDFSSKDNILLDFESAIQVRLTNPASVMSKFGPKWFENNVQYPYTAMARDQVKRYEMSAMMSDPVAAAAIDSKLTEEVRKLIKEAGIDAVVENVTLGRAKPNDNVLAQMNETAAQQQRVKTLTAAVAAEEQRKNEQIAKAAADNAYRNALGWTPEMYLAKQLADLQHDACIKAQSCYLVPQGTNVIAK